MRRIPNYHHHRRLRNRLGQVKVVIFYVAFKRLSIFNATSHKPKMLLSSSGSVYLERRDTVRYTNKRPPYSYRSKRKSMYKCMHDVRRTRLSRKMWTVFRAKYVKVNR